MALVNWMLTCRDGYAGLVNAVRRSGIKRSPRGLPTRDLGHVIVEIESPYDALPLNVGRSLNTAIAAAEAIQLVAGHARHDLLPRIAPAFKRYAEPDDRFHGTQRFHGAYGDRIGTQVASAIQKLDADRDTRQAIITLWNPLLDNQLNHKDYPCTVALRFSIVDDMLCLQTLMRSNDVWLGFPYDVFQFTQLQQTVARAFNIPPGKYTHEAWSLHLYEEHLELVDRLHEPETDSQPQPFGFGINATGPKVVALMEWRTARAHALYILMNMAPTKLTVSERWYVEQLQRYVSQT